MEEVDGRTGLLRVRGDGVYSLCRPEVEPVMTSAAERHEIFFAFRLQLASRDNVMDLELIAPAAVLASPAIALQDLPGQLGVGRRLKPNPPSVW